MSRRYPYRTAIFLEDAAGLMQKEDVMRLVPTTLRDIPRIMIKLESMENNRNSIIEAQMVLNACFMIIRRCVME